MSVEQLQIRISGNWHEGFFTSERGYIGPYEALISESSSYGPGFEGFYAFLGKETNYAWSTAENTFAAEPPYNYSQTPSWLQIQFNTPLVIDGVGIDGGDAFYEEHIDIASPSSFYLQGSTDGINWQKIENSDHVGIDTSNLALYCW